MADLNFKYKIYLSTKNFNLKYVYIQVLLYNLITILIIIIITSTFLFIIDFIFNKFFNLTLLKNCSFVEEKYI